MLVAVPKHRSTSQCLNTQRLSNHILQSCASRLFILFMITICSIEITTHQMPLSRTQRQPEVQSNVGEQQEVPCLTDIDEHYSQVYTSMMAHVAVTAVEDVAIRSVIPDAISIEIKLRPSGYSQCSPKTSSGSGGVLHRAAESVP